MKFHKTKFLAMIILCWGSAGFSIPNDKFEPRLGKKYILIFACKKGRTERLFYIIEFAGDHYGFDTWWIEIKDGKVVNVSGTI